MRFPSQEGEGQNWVTHWVHAEGWISHWNERLLVGSQTLGHHMGYWSTCVAAEAFRRPQCKTLHPSVCGESKIYTALGHGAGLQINLGKLLWKFWLAACEEEWGSISNSSWACSEYLMGDPLIILVTHICIVLSDSFLVWDPDLFLTENIQSGLSWGLRSAVGKRWEYPDFWHIRMRPPKGSNCPVLVANPFRKQQQLLAVF